MWPQRNMVTWDADMCHVDLGILWGQEAYKRVTHGTLEVKPRGGCEITLAVKADDVTPKSLPR